MGKWLLIFFSSCCHSEHVEELSKSCHPEPVEGFWGKEYRWGWFFFVGLVERGFVFAVAAWRQWVKLLLMFPEAAFAGRPVSTEDRIMVHNIVYDKMALLKIESEEVFRGDPARINQYNIYPPAAGVSTTVNIKVKKAGVPVTDATVELTNTGLAVQSVDGTGLVSFTSINMPDFVNIKVSSPTEGDLALDNQPVINGDENSIEISFP